MRLRRIYRNYIQNNLFVKVIFVFAVIVILTVIGFSYFLFGYISASIVRNDLSNQREAMDRVNLYLEQKYEWVQSVVQISYRDNLLSDNVSYLLKHSYQEYIQYRLGEGYSPGSGNSTNAISYFGDKFEADADIRNIIVYSSDKQTLYAYKSVGSPKIYQTNTSRSYIPDMMSLDGANASTPNVWVRKLINQWDTRLYSMRVRINDKDTLKNIGQLIVYFDSEMVRQALTSSAGAAKGSILVLTADNQVMFDSSGRYYGHPYPYADRLGVYEDTAKLEEPSYVSILQSATSGYRIVGIAPKSEMAKSYERLKNTIILIAAVCILIAVIIPSLLIVSISRRTNKIVRFMKKVEGGDLNARLQDSREDELGQISRSFNEMVEELNRMIDREYKSELRLRQSEFAALQARVNPHFLYNTLEAIRMRALSQGADDVGEMIYSLAALFRGSIRPSAEAKLNEELEMCRLYLELFRIRYKDKLAFEIECPPELLAVRIPKLMLQPLVENYIVHGMESQRRDNRIAIRAEAANGLIRVKVWNNGKPIDPERLKRIRAELDYPETESSSFGLRSVHERLKLAYGAGYGLSLESDPEEGTTVTVEFPDPNRVVEERRKEDGEEG
ncbi:sensor histidine kinase [Cohnella fermenti]|uniref:Sensor histidine kinase n=1 Tax=Cohnella fermenti TaxID=2565925 RepID=A0A4S4BGJ0_9BACL|nr:sensor histidine kinase [Cohnella fermenti]THF73567.1 sensor histidine kinase [Cohnella fermenti]